MPSRCCFAPQVANEVAIVWLFQMIQLVLSHASIGTESDLELAGGMTGSLGPITCCNMDRNICARDNGTL